MSLFTGPGLYYRMGSLPLASVSIGQVHRNMSSISSVAPQILHFECPLSEKKNSCCALY